MFLFRKKFDNAGFAKIWLVFLVLVIASIAIFVLYHDKIFPNDYKLTISPKWVNQAQFAGMFVALDKGLYKDKGIDLTIKEFGNNSSVIDDLENGTSQLGLMSANEFLTNYEKDNHLVAIAAFYQVSPFTVVTLDSSNITNPVDLKNKKMGIKGGPGAEGESVYKLLLNYAKIPYDKNNINYIKFGTPEFQDLIENKVDSIGLYRTDQLYFFNNNGTKYNLLNPEDYGSAIYNDVLVAKDSFLLEHGDIAKAFLKATVDAWNYAYEHKEEAIVTTLKYVTQEAYKNINYERFILSQSESLMKNRGNRIIGEMNAETWQHSYQTLYDLGYIQKPFDIGVAFTNKYLP